MPRYTFRAPTEWLGCGTPGHFDSCLCDVIVTNPAPIFVGQRLMFGDLALKEIDADRVSERNIVEFASVLLGCYEEYLHCPLPEYTPYDDYDMPANATMDRERPSGARPTGAWRKQAPSRQTRKDSPVATRSARKRPSLGAAPNEWQWLPEDVRDHLVMHWRVGTPWSFLQHLMPDKYDAVAIARVRGYYREKAREYRSSAKHKAAKKERKARSET